MTVSKMMQFFLYKRKMDWKCCQLTRNTQLSSKVIWSKAAATLNLIVMGLILGRLHSYLFGNLVNHFTQTLSDVNSVLDGSLKDSQLEIFSFNWNATSYMRGRVLPSTNMWSLISMNFWYTLKTPKRLASHCSTRGSVSFSMVNISSTVPIVQTKTLFKRIVIYFNH